MKHALKLLSILSFTLPFVVTIGNALASNVNPAPSADLIYKIKSNQKGIPVSGEAKIQWRLLDGAGEKLRYSLASETSVSLLGKILSTSSAGQVNDNGLVPELFIEKRFRRQQTQTNFDKRNKQIIFSGGEPPVPLKGGEQDRLSVTWQLVALARYAGEQLRNGLEWRMTVAGVHDADIWSFQILGKTTLRTELGDVEAIHILRAPPSDALGQHLELWLAPSLDYYPVRISFTDNNGDKVDQRISKIQKLNSN